MDASVQEAGQKIFSPFTDPPQDWRDKQEYEFLTFVLQFQEDNCQNCGATIGWSNVFRAFGKKGHDRSNYRRLVPATAVPESAPVVIFRMPPRIIPICHHCLKGDRPGQGVFLVASEHEWNEARRREREVFNASRAARSVVVAKREDLDDIPI